MPDPATLMAQISAGGAVPSPPATRAPAPAAAATASSPGDFAGFVAAIERTGKKLLALQLHDNVGLVSFAEGDITLKPLKPLGADFTRDLATVAKEVTGMAWQIRLTDDGGAPSLQQQEVMAEEAVRRDVMGEPSVRALLDAFPDATYVSHQRKEA
jgi:DNA polymerase III subunit gamma/tau